VAAARRIHDDVEAFEALVGRLEAGAETKLAIAVDAMFPIDALIAFSKEFVEAHPEVELIVRTEMLDAVVALVRTRRATLGIAGTDADLGGLEHRHLADVPMIPVVAPTHPLAQQKGPIEGAALASEVQIVLSERRATSEPGSGDHGVFSRRVWRVADLTTKHALIVAGLGFGHEPEHLVREDLEAGRLVPLRLAAWESAPPRRSLCLVRREGVALGPVARWATERLTGLCRLAIDHHAR
jgi:DNA-binding transcriptional LysR family regulator